MDRRDTGVDGQVAGGRPANGQKDTGGEMAGGRVGCMDRRTWVDGQTDSWWRVGCMERKTRMDRRMDGWWRVGRTDRRTQGWTDALGAVL